MASNHSAAMVDRLTALIDELEKEQAAALQRMGDSRAARSSPLRSISPEPPAAAPNAGSHCSPSDERNLNDRDPALFEPPLRSCAGCSRGMPNIRKSRAKRSASERQHSVCLCIARVASSPSAAPSVASPSFPYGDYYRISSRITRSRRPFWSPDQALESEDEAVHFRAAQLDLHHQSR